MEVAKSAIRIHHIIASEFLYIMNFLAVIEVDRQAFILYIVETSNHGDLVSYVLSWVVTSVYVCTNETYSLANLHHLMQA